MLPIRLGTLNADGPQELFIYLLSRNGRVETTNYRTVKLPTGMNLPLFIKSEFGEFYRAMFYEQVKKEDMRAVFLEYAWDMNWCDPCAADPLSSDELRSLGVFWIENDNTEYRNPTGPTDVFITRLHVKYDKEHFPEDLMSQETGYRTNFQARYVLHHPWKGGNSCEASKHYAQQLQKRQENEARILANLTGWNINNINKKIDYVKYTKIGEKPWWKAIWTD